MIDPHTQEDTMITITNNFHNTSYRLRATIGAELSAAQIRRSRKALCGMHDCTCGGPLGERGKQDGFRIEQIDAHRVKIVIS